MRRVIDHAFSDKASRDQEPIVTGHIDNLIQRLHVQTSGPNQGQVDVVEWYNWMSFDIIGDLSFGQSFACLETQTYHPWVDTIFGNLKGITFMGACNRFTIPRYILPFLIPKRIKQMMNDHWAATTANVDRRLKLGTDRPDFMSPILRHNNDEKASLRREELMSNASLFVIAGSEAVATNLVGTTYYLLQNPNIMRKIREEVDSAFTSEDQITPQSVANLPYLQACLSETNRIYPGALTGQAMKVPPAGDAICGIWVPGGVSFSCYTQRDIWL
jgi:cytochrome P450